MNLWPLYISRKTSVLAGITGPIMLKYENWLLAGDFNTSRWAHEKSSGKATKSMRHFNNFIREAELIDLPLSNGLYTWSNNRSPPTLTLIDRFLATEDLLEKFSNAGVQKLNRPTSDHYPILLSMGCCKWGPSPFRFENMWLNHSEFLPMVEYWWRNTKRSPKEME